MMPGRRESRRSRLSLTRLVGRCAGWLRRSSALVRSRGIHRMLPLHRQGRQLRDRAGPVPTPAIEVAAQRVASLLRGGVPTSRVWRVLAAEPDDSRELRDALIVIEARQEAGFDASAALAEVAGPQWRVLAATWRVAEQSGATVAPVLDRFAVSMRDLAKLAEHRSVLLTGPRSTIRLVIALPPLALLLGGLLGFDPLPALATPTGLATAMAGLLLLAVGALWASALTQRVARADWVAGWEFELMAIALGSGSPPGAASLLAVDSADVARAEWVRLEGFAARGAVTALIASGQSLGTPLGPLLQAEAERRRAQALVELEQAAERLGVSVLLPLGACVLPAFVLLGVVPVLLAVLGGAGF